MSVTIHNIHNRVMYSHCLCTVLKDWRQNMREKNGGGYKEAVVKVM